MKLNIKMMNDIKMKYENTSNDRTLSTEYGYRQYNLKKFEL